LKRFSSLGLRCGTPCRRQSDWPSCGKSPAGTGRVHERLQRTAASWRHADTNTMWCAGRATIVGQPGEQQALVEGGVPQSGAAATAQAVGLGRCGRRGSGRRGCQKAAQIGFTRGQCSGALPDAAGGRAQSACLPSAPD